MSLDEIQENRSEYIKKVATHVEEAIKHTGLELETVSLTSLNQAPVSVFDPSNTFDAEEEQMQDVEMRIFKWFFSPID